MKKIIFLSVVGLSANLFSFDRFFDISLTTDFANLKERSHIDFNSQAAFPFSNKAFLLNPRLSVFFDGTMDVSVATGLRYEFEFGTLGHHLFWDSSGNKDAHFHQLGHSLDFLTPIFDFRVNYYHPITKEQTDEKFIISPHRWVEGEVVWKNRFCQLGLGPKYDLFKKRWGSQARIVFPFRFFSIGSLISHDKNNGVSGCFSLSFRLFSTPRQSFLQSPICHRSRVQYSKQVIVIPPPVIGKRLENKSDQAPKTEVTSSTVGSPSVDESNDVDEFPPSPPEPSEPAPPKSWWNFFFRSLKNNL